MKYAILGTGMVGSTLGTKLAALGHEVVMGSRSADNEKASAWAKASGDKASHGTYADAASQADIIFNCTNGMGSMEALNMAGKENLAGKILVDVANPLDFSKGMPPTLFVSGRDSLGERIQATFSEAKVVKALNTVNCNVMVDPGRVPGSHALFVCGNDEGAKKTITALLTDEFGWKSVVDLGDITGSRATESYLLFWLRLMQTLKTSDFNVEVRKGE